MKQPARVWPVVLFWLAVGGCGGAQTRSEAPQAQSRTTAAGGIAEEAPPDHRAEIERLEREIASRTTAVPPERGPVSPPEAPPGTEPGVPGVSRPTHDGELVCEQACQASGSICRAAQRICSLADDMGDEWARGKCRSAQRTCTDTRRRATNACGTC